MARVKTDIFGINELNGWEWENLIQTTILFTTVGKNPLEETKQTTESTKESEMQYLLAISKMSKISVHFQGKPFHITVLQSMTQPLMLKKLKWKDSIKTYKKSQSKQQKQQQQNFVFIIGDWNAQVGSQEIPGITDNFGFGV